MTELLYYLNKHPIHVWQFDDYLKLAVTHPTFFFLIVLLLLDIITGISATIIQKTGLDSSIAFKGWVKHTVILTVCFIFEFSFTAIGMPIIGNILTILAYTVYIPSFIGNLEASGIKLPSYIQELFKREIHRKFEKYLETKEKEK